MGGFDEYKPVMAMVVLQFCYAGVSLSTRVGLLQGMSPRVFVVYRQAIATLVVAPIAYFSRKKFGGCSMGLRSFCLIFSASLVGVAINQNLYFEGLYLSSSSTATAMINLVPAVTFVMASLLGLEKVNLRSLRSAAKIVGTILCVGSAMSMTFLRGPKLLNFELAGRSLFGSDGESVMGCVFLFLGCFTWSVWLILQASASRIYPDHLSLTAWMCFLSTIQSATITFFIEPNLLSWKLTSALELSCCFFSGVVGSGFAFLVQAWCISKRGPLFSAMFNPLCTVIVTIFAALFLHETIYTGGLVGAIGVVIGLYVLLWGKAKDNLEIRGEINQNLQNSRDIKQVEECCKIDLEEPLLYDQKLIPSTERYNK